MPKGNGQSRQNQSGWSRERLSALFTACCAWCSSHACGVSLPKSRRGASVDKCLSADRRHACRAFDRWRPSIEMWWLTASSGVTACVLPSRRYEAIATISPGPFRVGRQFRAAARCVNTMRRSNDARRHRFNGGRTSATVKRPRTHQHPLQQSSPHAVVGSICAHDHGTVEVCINKLFPTLTSSTTRTLLRKHMNNSCLQINGIRFYSEYVCDPLYTCVQP